MYLENIVIDAVDPHRLGGFWRQLLDAEPLTDGPEGFEMRVHLGPDSAPGTFLDICLQPVPEPPHEPLRLHLDLLGGPAQTEIVEKALALGAAPLDIGQGDVQWVVLGDPEGNPFCVLPAPAG
jgi:hypothetical protein